MIEKPILGSSRNFYSPLRTVNENEYCIPEGITCITATINLNYGASVWLFKKVNASPENYYV